MNGTRQHWMKCTHTKKKDYIVLSMSGMFCFLTFFYYIAMRQYEKYIGKVKTSTYIFITYNIKYRWIFVRGNFFAHLDLNDGWLKTFSGWILWGGRKGMCTPGLCLEEEGRMPISLRIINKPTNYAKVILTCTWWSTPSKNYSLNHNSYKNNRVCQNVWYGTVANTQSIGIKMSRIHSSHSVFLISTNVSIEL